MAITEVAKLAGVSHTTVSRVINKRPGVSRKSIQSVHEAMRQIGYVPPTHRRGPQPKEQPALRTRTIATLLIGTEVDIVRTPLIVSIFQAVERVLNGHNLAMTFGQVMDDGQLPANVASGQVDGVLALGRVPEGQLRQRLEWLPTCWLLTRRGTAPDWGDRVEPNNEQVGVLAARHLLERGHERLIYLNPVPAHPAFLTRGEAFAATARSAGAEVTLRQSSHKDSDKRLRSTRNQLSATVLEHLADQMQAVSPKPTGVFVCNDNAAAMLQAILVSRGVRVGQDVEIVSCGNEWASLAGLDPKPATIDLRPETIGRLAVDQLLWRIEHPHEPARSAIRVEPYLVTPPEGDAEGGQAEAENLQLS